MDVTQLNTLSRIEIKSVDRSLLADIQEITIDTSMPVPARMLKYLGEIKNPYCFRCGNTPVKIRFREDGEDLGDLLKAHFINLKR